MGLQWNLETLESVNEYRVLPIDKYKNRELGGWNNRAPLEAISKLVRRSLPGETTCSVHNAFGWNSYWHGIECIASLIQLLLPAL